MASRIDRVPRTESHETRRRVVYRHPFGVAAWLVLSVPLTAFYFSTIRDDPARYFNWGILSLQLAIVAFNWRLLVSASVVANGAGLVLRRAFTRRTRVL